MVDVAGTGLPLDSVVNITSTVAKNGLSVEKQHGLLFLKNNKRFPSDKNFIKVNGSDAFNVYFNETQEITDFVIQYFGRTTKAGDAPDALVVANWYKDNSSAIAFSSKITNQTKTIANLQANNPHSFQITIDSVTQTISVDLSTITNISDACALIETEVNAQQGTTATNITCTFDSVKKIVIIENDSNGSSSNLNLIEVANDTILRDLSFYSSVGILTAQINNGVDAETLRDAYDRVYLSNNTGYSYFNLLNNTDITLQDYFNLTSWLQDKDNLIRVVVRFIDKSEAEAFATYLKDNDLNGFVIVWDKFNDFSPLLITIAETAARDLSVISTNYNFLYGKGIPVTTLNNTPAQYQQGDRNALLVDELDTFKISYIYNVGYGSNSEKFYGKGFVNGRWKNEAVQVNEQYLIRVTQVALFNLISSANKISIYDGRSIMTISTILASIFESAKRALICVPRELSIDEKNAVTQAAGSGAIGQLESLGYYFKILDVNDEDKRLGRLRVLRIYTSDTPLNKIVISDIIY